MKNKMASCEEDLKLPKSNPLVIVISGPSGVGKDAILNRMKERKFPFEFITTMTTRARRANERDLVDYHFVSMDEFNELIKNDGLLEYAQVYGNYYGVPKQSVREALANGRDTIIKVDVQGAASIRKIIPEAVLIFIAPPSLAELSNRLIGRCTENATDLEIRIKISKNELQQVHNFDYVVINPSNQIDIAIDEIKSIITAEKRRATPRKIDF